jgi:predicted ester cyclase
LRGLVTAYRAAVPDLDMPVIEQYCDADAGAVTSVWLASGTQLGEMLGVPPTGVRGGNVMGITITQFEGGKIARDRAVWDALGLLRQLGVIPAPEAVEA